MEEKFKHRLVGVLVLLSLLIIFAPFVVSNPQGLMRVGHIGMTSKIPSPPGEFRVPVTQPKPSWITPVPHIEVKENVLTNRFVARSVAEIATSVAEHKRLHQAYAHKTAPVGIHVRPLSSVTYKLQVGIFRNHRQAQAMLDGLKQQGYDVHIESFKGKKGAVMKKIWIEGYYDHQQLQALQKQIDKDLRVKSLIVKSSKTAKRGG